MLSTTKDNQSANGLQNVEEYREELKNSIHAPGFKAPNRINAAIYYRKNVSTGMKTFMENISDQIPVYREEFRPPLFGSRTSLA